MFFWVIISITRGLIIRFTRFHVSVITFYEHVFIRENEDDDDDDDDNN